MRFALLSGTFLTLLGLIFCVATPVPAGTVTAYRISSPDSLLSGASADGAVGDVMLQNGNIAVVISNIGHVVSPALSGGNIIDAGAATDRADALVALYTYFDDEWPRQAVYSSLSIVNDGSGGGPAHVEAVGVDSADSNLRVFTHYYLEANTAAVRMATMICYLGGAGYADFELGDAFHWGSCTKFAPGYGFSPTGTTTEPWIAGTSGEIVYGYCGMVGDVWGPHGNAWSDVNVTSVDFGPQVCRTYERYLVIGEGDIASVATVIHDLTATPAGFLSCTVHELDSGAPLPGATIDVFDPLDDMYLQMVAGPDGGGFTTLPAGDWRLEASSPGYLSEETWISVPQDGSVAHGFDLAVDDDLPAMGDTLTVIQRPLLNVPALVRPGDILPVTCKADPSATGWSVRLIRGRIQVPLAVSRSSYDPSTLLWTITTVIPEVPLYELYDLEVSLDGGIDDSTKHAVRVVPEFKEDYYFVHITDTHLPTHAFYTESGSESDSSEIEDLREVIADLNLINPEFVLLTGDVVNEGELEDFQGRRYYSRAQRVLGEFEVPVFVTSGNHDIGGWDETPMPDGTARRDWWRFFGWGDLDDPPPGAPWHTQNFSFDYGSAHYVGLESYLNYDMWRSEIYGTESFTAGQMEWLTDDLAAAAGSASRILFYHYDFANQIDLGALGAEMALWGHTHGNHDDFTPPYDVGTDNVCDGARSYRLVRVSGGVPQPTATISAGGSGLELLVTYDPPNDGTNWIVTGTVTNNHGERFEHGQLRFRMPKGGTDVQVTGGTLAQVDDSGVSDIYYVDIHIQPNSVQTVTLTIEEPISVPPQSPIPARARLDRNVPNPFGRATRIPFVLPKACPVKLEVFDVRGHLVAVLLDETLPAGWHEAHWDGRGQQGTLARSGIYFIRLNTGSEVLSRKILLAR
jgi:predicted MPP superfamily phosphohydrolase